MKTFVSLTSLALMEALALAQTTIGFGPYFSLGPTKSWIREANTTLVLPTVPNPAVDRLALWPGMGTSDGDLIQAIAVATANPATECRGTTGQWCVFASTLESQQEAGTQSPQNAGAHLIIHYVYNDSTQKYDQAVSINGKVLSTLSTSSGNAQGWGTAVECQESACPGTVATHQYLDTTIVLNAADPTFGNTLALNEVSSSGLSTTDGGKTWVVKTIKVQQHTFNL
ncbi:hypothetical protein JX266_011124 [Neoarthrinium moseri]|nr:hypothetical protein JX266_011124 [Neoarthrinium moseri]